MKNKVQPMTKLKDNSRPPVDIFNEYYSFNRRILCIIGQWPYQTIPERFIRVSMLLFLSISIAYVQIQAVITRWGSFHGVLECLSPIAANLGCDLKMFNIMIHTAEIKKLFELTQKDWDRVRHLPEINILRNCGEKGKRYSISYFLLFYTIIFGWVMVSLIQKQAAGSLGSSNGTQKSLYMFPTDYNIDPDEYFYPILFHCSAGTTMCILSIVAHDTIYMILAQHVSAMFKILRQHVEDISKNDDINITLNPNLHDDSHYRTIVECVKRHKILIAYIKNIQSSCEWCLLVAVGLNTLSLSVTGYQTIAKDNAKEDLLRFGLFTLAQAVHLYCNILPGHWIKSSSSLFPDAVYSSKWYTMSLRSRKLLVFLIGASIKPCTITAGKVYELSIQNFCNVLRTSVSYLTVLNKVQ